VYINGGASAGAGAGAGASAKRSSVRRSPTRGSAGLATGCGLARPACLNAVDGRPASKLGRNTSGVGNSSGGGRSADLARGRPLTGAGRGLIV